MPHISIPKIRLKALLTQDLEGLPKSKSLGVKGHYPLVRLGSLLSHSDGVFCIGIPVRVKEMKDEISCYFPLAALVELFACEERISHVMNYSSTSGLCHKWLITSRSLSISLQRRVFKSLPLQEISNHTGPRITADPGMEE